MRSVPVNLVVADILGDRYKSKGETQLVYFLPLVKVLDFIHSRRSGARSAMQYHQWRQHGIYAGGKPKNGFSIISKMYDIRQKGSAMCLQYISVHLRKQTDIGMPNQSMLFSTIFTDQVEDSQ